MELSLAQVFYAIATSSIIVLLYLVIFFLVVDLLTLVHAIPRAWFTANWYGTLFLIVSLSGIFVYGNIHYYHKERVTIDLQTTKPLPHDYTIVMLSDLHLGYHNTRADFAKWVDLINAEKPDLILIAGDIIDISLRPLLEEHMAEEFHRLEAPIYACLGNHEYYSNQSASQQFYKEAGIHLLIDEHAVVDDAICIVGRDDLTDSRRQPLPDLLKKAASEQKYTILLDHQPYHLEQAEKGGVDFQLSGHTHRGQVWPISWITDAIYECSWGSHQRGDTQYYVSSGIGIWGGKFRIGTQSEYVVARLHN